MIGPTIRELLMRAGLDDLYLAVVTGVTNPTLSLFLTGKRMPRRAVFEKILLALKIDAHDLILMSEFKNQKSKSLKLKVVSKLKKERVNYKILKEQYRLKLKTKRLTK